MGGGGGLNIHGFWYLQGLLYAIPHRYQGTTKFWGEAEVTCRFSTAQVLGTSNPQLFKGQLDLKPKNNMNNLRSLILSIWFRTLGDKQPPPDNLNLEKGFVQVLGHLTEFKI